jgi:hypothetical protein
MNRDFQIYRVLEDEISLEDEARLEGYLEGKAEAAKLLDAELKQKALREESMRRRD